MLSGLNRHATVDRLVPEQPAVAASRLKNRIPKLPSRL